MTVRTDAGKAEAQGPSADDIKAAMREAEDEGDAAAAAALEQEAAADLAEFNADPVPAATAEADGDDDDAEPDDGRCSLEPFRGCHNQLYLGKAECTRMCLAMEVFCGSLGSYDRLLFCKLAC